MASDEPVFVALGSNLGDSEAILLRAMERLEEVSTRPLVRSSFWQSAPLDCPPDSPSFVNAMVEMWVRTDVSPQELLRRLRALEADFGRQAKGVRNAPRTLDLDLIAYGARTLSEPELILPHPRAQERRFVLEPWAEIAPDFIPPNQSVSVAELLRRLPFQEISKITK